jgi:hypothetical protein
LPPPEILRKPTPAAELVDGLTAHVLDSGLFELMLTPTALAIVAPLLREETTLVAGIATRDSAYDSVVAVGDAAQTYRTLAARIDANYVCIDPHLSPQHGVRPSTAHSHRALLLRKGIGSLDTKELPIGKTLWIIHFNLFPYLASAADDLAEVCRDGDRVVISVWGRSPLATALQRDYDRELARLSGMAPESVTRRLAVVPLPPFSRYRTIRGHLVELHEFHAGDPVPHSSDLEVNRADDVPFTA